MNLFIKKGKKCLSQLDGMFAFCIWDEDKQEMFCARDRFGEKPFFYYHKDGSFVFASEIKSIITYLNKVDFNFNYLQQYLNGGFQFSDLQTAFVDIQALAPASLLLINNNELLIEKYWEIDLSKSCFWKVSKPIFLNFMSFF
ncbi:MAG: hypothetical protein IPJ26_13280 [Bacteroidetes bacterium]|nr:hypothetical protein [Bacteroidota bacterium]